MNRIAGEVKNRVHGKRPRACPLQGAFLILMLVSWTAMAQPSGLLFQRSQRIGILDANGGGYPNGSAKANALGNVDGDGAIDMVVGYMVTNWNTNNPPTYRIAIYYNTGDPTNWGSPQNLDFTPAAIPNPPYYDSFSEKYDTIEDIAIADIDGDGFRDILFCTHVDGVLWFRQTANRVFAASPYNNILSRNTAYNYYVNCRRVLAVNLDNDAELEVVVARGETTQAGGYNSSGRVSVYNRSGALPFTWTETTVENYSGSAAFPVSLRAANLAGTSHLDLVVCWKASNTVKWYLNNGSGAFTTVTPTGVTYNEPYDTGFADVDKDGDLDIIVVQRAASSPGASVRVLFNDGTTGANNFTGTFTVSSGYVGYRNAGDPYDTISNDKYPIYVEGGDFDQDGDGDFFVSWNNLSTPTRANGDVIYFENTNGAGTSWTEFSLYTSGLNSPADTGPMQMEIITAAPSTPTTPPGYPDAYPDLAVYNRSSKTLSFWNQTTYTTAPYLTNLVVIGAREVHVTFSEAMNASDVATLAYYEASGAGRGSLAVNPTGVSNVSGNTYRLTWSSGQLQLGGALTITANAAMRDAGGYRIREPRSLTVTVTDTQAPVVGCQNLVRTLSPTSVTVAVGEVSTGATDNWTPPSPIELKIKRSGDPDGSYADSVTFTCADIGPQAVTVRARDVALNAGTCTATVTIQGTMINQLQAPTLRELYVGDALPGVQVIADCGVPPYSFQWQYSATPGFASPQNCNNGQPHPADPSVTISVVNASPSSTLSFSSATLPTVGYYRCIATDSAVPTPSTATSGNFQLDVKQAVAATDPVGGHRNVGGSITFSTTASQGYTPYSYAWYKSSNPGVPLTNGAQPSGSTISGATTNSMTISNLQTADADSYYCIVTDRLISGSGSTKQTNAAALTVTVLLAIAGPTPSSAYIYGTAQNFDVTASGGDGNYGFSWEWDADGFGTGNPAQPLSSGTHPNGVTAVTITDLGGGVNRLALTNITQNASGEYRCTVADGSPDPDVTSAAAVLQKRSAVSVSVAPVSASLKNYIDPLTLTATASGGFAPLTYQWALSTDGGLNWTNLSNGTFTFTRPGYDPLVYCTYTVDVQVTVSGATGSVLTIDHPLFTIHGGLYRCTVEDAQYPIQGLPQGTASAQSTVTVTDQVAIVRQPQGGEYYNGNDEEMSIAVIGGTISVDPGNPCSAPLNYQYQWRYGPSGINNSGMNPFTFTARSQVPPTPPPPPYQWPDYTGYSGSYNVQVNDTSTSTARTSQSAAITVRDEVHFTTAPQNQTKNVTESVTFPVVVAGGYPGYTYAWTWNSIVLTNGPHPSGSGSTVSGATTATLSITNLGETDEGTYEVVANDTKAPCPAHNNKCSATASAVLTVSNHIVILDPPDSLDVYDGDNVSFSVTAGGGDPPTYEYAWYWDFGSGGVQLNNGAHPSGTGAFISGATTPTLTITGVELGAQPQFSDAGNYYVIVGDAPPENNPAQSAPAVLGIYAPVRFTTNPVALNRYQNESAVFTVAASGGLLNQRSYQWQVDAGSGFSNLSNGGNVSGATTTSLTISPTALGDNGKRYRCVVTSPDSDVPTDPSNTTHTSGSALLQVSTALSILDRPADVQAYVTDPPFDLRVHFQGGMAPYSSQWRRAGLDPVSPEVSAGTGTLILGTPNTTVLTVIPGSLTPGLYAYAAQLTDQVRMTRSQTGTVEVANNLNFVRGLSNVFVRQKQRFTWEIEVSGGLGALQYQWFKDDGTKAWVPVPEDPFHQGTTTASLEFVEIDFDDAGLYRIEVSDDFTMISSQAQMSVGVALPAVGLAGLALLSAVSALAGAAGLRRRQR